MGSAVHCCRQLPTDRHYPSDSTLEGLLRLPHNGVALNETFTGEGVVIYKHACALGCEGVVSKRLGSPYRVGRSPYWLKIKNPAGPAVRREAEEDWGTTR